MISVSPILKKKKAEEKISNQHYPITKTYKHIAKRENYKWVLLINIDAKPKIKYTASSQLFLN